MGIIQGIKGMGKKAVLLLVVLVVAGSLVGVYLVFQEEQPQEIVAAYKEETVTRGDLTVGAAESGTAFLVNSSISYPVSVEVEEIYVRPGQRIQAGDQLLRVNLESLKDEYNTIQASYNSATLKLEQAIQNQKTGTIQAKYALQSDTLNGETADLQYDYEIAEIASNLSDAEDKLYNAQEDEDYWQEQKSDLKDQMNSAYTAWQEAKIAATATEEELAALEKTYTSLKKSYEDAVDKYTSARKSVTNYAASVGKLEAQHDLSIMTAEASREKSVAGGENAQAVYEATISQLETNIQSARADVNTYKKELEKLAPYVKSGVITANDAGLVISVDCAVGDTINKSGSLLTIASQKTYVTLTIAQEDIAGIALDQTAQITFKAYPDESFEGRVDGISYTPARSAATTVSYTVTVALDEHLEKVFQGMTCDVLFISKQKKDVLYISNRAVITQEGKQYAKVKDEAGAITQVEITTGFSDGRRVEVTGGLEEKQTVIIESQVVS